MDDGSRKLREQLKRAGLSDQAIDAAWPSWWDDAAAGSPSARSELRFALSRNLGLSPKSLLGERVEFVWQDEARFKNLTAAEEFSRAALASFGVAVGRLLLRATPEVRPLGGIPAAELRDAILASHRVVDLFALVVTCWGLGVPVIHLRVFPLRAKRMRAMVVSVDGRHAILLGRDSRYASTVAFTLAHEIGHAALDHAGSGQALVDIGDAAYADGDDEETEADTYGLELLTGSAVPEITTNIDDFGGRELAEACKIAGPPRRIDPGTLALCLGHIKSDWITANAALRYLYGEGEDVWRNVNSTANNQLDWSALSDDSARYLRIVMGADG